MAKQKVTYTIKHPAGIAISLFSINYKAHDKKALRGDTRKNISLP